MISRNNNKSSGKGFILGALLGMLAGGVAALLLTPKTGKEMQSEFKNRTKKMVGRTDVQVSEMETELEDHIDTLKVVARDLRGEAYDESQRLITRAEILRNDLEDSATRLVSDADPQASDDAKRLVTEGQTVIEDLERMTRRIMSDGDSEN